MTAPHNPQGRQVEGASSGPGSREPSPAVSALTGFDPSRGLHILQHSLGVDQYGRGRRYRTHFVTGEGSLDWEDCCALARAGLMTRQEGGALTGGNDVFHVTGQGQRFVTANSPSPPKESRSKQRYRAYLASESGLSFGEWVKRPWLHELRRAR